MVVGQGFPIRKSQGGYRRRRVEADLAYGVECGFGIRRHVDHQVVGGAGQARTNEGPPAAVEALPVEDKVRRRGLGRRRRLHGVYITTLDYHSYVIAVVI